MAAICIDIFFAFYAKSSGGRTGSAVNVVSIVVLQSEDHFVFEGRWFVVRVLIGTVAPLQQSTPFHPYSN